MKVSLSDGGWADIRDPRKLNERQTGELEDAQMEALSHVPPGVDFEKLQDANTLDTVRSVGVAGFRALREMKRANILVYVSEWSFGPVTREVLLEDVPGVVAQELFDEIGKIIRATGGPKLNVEPSPDPESPISPLQG